VTPEPDQATARCSQCGRGAPAVDLPARGRICIECRRSNGRIHYRVNREYYIRKAKARNARTSAEVRDWLLNYLAQHPCVDCGTPDTRVLEFDHRDPAQKRAEVSVLASNGYSVRTVKDEVAKCDVRCANCHTIRTREQGGWWRSEECARHDSNVQPFDP
jgi:hypothetical protein